jgi:hypothetical protein
VYTKQQLVDGVSLKKKEKTKFSLYTFSTEEKIDVM